MEVLAIRKQHCLGGGGSVKDFGGGSCPRLLKMEKFLNAYVALTVAFF